jgi:hypothetical protein
MKAGAVLRAISVLIRRHPKAAVSAASAAVVQAGRIGAGDLKWQVGNQLERLKLR